MTRLAGAQVNLKNTWKPMEKFLTNSAKTEFFFFEKNVYFENFQKTKNLDFWRPPGASNGFPQK